MQGQGVSLDVVHKSERTFRRLERGRGEQEDGRRRIVRRGEWREVRKCGKVWQQARVSKI